MFKGRVDELEDLSNLFSEKNRDTKKTTVCWLDGIGGIGKSAITFEYAKKYQENYTRLIFVDCENIEKFKESLDVIAYALVGKVGSSQEETQALVKKDLDEDPKKYLLIFDNVDTEKLVKEVANLIPSNPRADVIINGRHDAIKDEIKTVRIPLGELDVKDGLDLFKALLSLSRRESFEKYESQADQENFIKEQLGCLPKAIEMAAGYFENNNRASRVSIEDYREIQRSLDPQKMKWILEESKKRTRSNIEKTIYETYSPNIRAISNDFKEPFDAGKWMVYDVLRFLSFFGMLRNIALPDNSMDQLRDCFIKTSNKKEIYQEMGEQEFKKFFEKIIGELVRHKLIEGEPSKGVWNITIHQTIKEVIHYEYLYEIRDEVKKLKELTGDTKKNIEKKRFAWFFAVGPYFNALIKNREDSVFLENPQNLDLAILVSLGLVDFADEMSQALKEEFSILVSLVDFADEYKMSQPLKEEFFKELKILDIIVRVLDSNNIYFLKKACAQLNVEDLCKLLKAALGDDKAINQRLRLIRAETISSFGEAFIPIDLQRAKKLSEIALEAGSISANRVLGRIYFVEANNFESGSEEEKSYLHQSIKYNQFFFEKESKISSLYTANAHYIIGLCKKRLGRIEDAAQSFQQAIDLRNFIAKYYREKASVVQDEWERIKLMEIAEVLDQLHKEVDLNLLDRKKRHFLLLFEQLKTSKENSLS